MILYILLILLLHYTNFVYFFFCTSAVAGKRSLHTQATAAGYMPSLSQQQQRQQQQQRHRQRSWMIHRHDNDNGQRLQSDRPVNRQKNRHFFWNLSLRN